MPIDPTPEAQGIQHQPAVKPFPQPTPEDKEKDKDVEREDIPAAEDENQPGFIGERNRPHP